MTPELKELIARSKQLMQNTYGRKSRTIDRARIDLDGVEIKVDYGVFTILVQRSSNVFIAYVETPSGQNATPDWSPDPATVLRGLSVLRKHMVLDDLAEATSD